MITNSTRVFHLFQPNFMKVPEAYIVDRTADEACMGEKSSNCLIQKNHISTKNRWVFTFAVFNKCKVPKGLLN